MMKSVFETHNRGSIVHLKVIITRISKYPNIPINVFTSYYYSIYLHIFQQLNYKKAEKTLNDFIYQMFNGPPLPPLSL